MKKSIESSLCDYSDAYFLVTGDITITGGNTNTKVAFENCAPFKKCWTEINDTFVYEADFINIVMPMYNLIEYSDNYSHTSGSIWQFKKDEIATIANVCNANSFSFKYKSGLIGYLAADEANGKKEKAKIVVPLKYLRNFWRPLEISLINCKVELSLTWIENCVLSGKENTNNVRVVANSGTAANFKMTDAKLYVPIVTLSTEDSAKLARQLNEGLKRPVYWNKYKVIDNKVVEITAVNAKKDIRELLDSSFQGTNRLFVLAYDNTTG